MSDRSAKDKAMASSLRDKGIFHGKRNSPATQGINLPKQGDVGSAAYRRLRDKKMRGRQS